MLHDCELIIMNFNKLRQCYKPIFFKLLFHNMFVKSEKNIYNKLLKISSYRIFPYGNLQKKRSICEVIYLTIYKKYERSFLF